jgi:TfoX N-terminal domain
MAYDEVLTNRIREALAGERRVAEIKMMGGLCFMIRGHMALAIVGDELMIRVGPDGYERALGRVHAREMDLTGRSMKGFVIVEPAGIRTKRSLASWVAPAAAFARSLPPKVRRRTKSLQRKALVT